MSKRDKIRAVSGWMCLIDFDYELGEAACGTKIYASEEDLLRNRLCVVNCGMAEVVTLSKEGFLKLVEKSGLSEDDFLDSYIGDVIYTKPGLGIPDNGKVETKITKICDRCKQETDRLYQLYEPVAFGARKYEDFKFLLDLCKTCRDKLKLFLEEK